jgi:hypothetical protein
VSGERVFVFQSSADGQMVVVVDVCEEAARARARQAMNVPLDEVAQLWAVADKGTAVVLQAQVGFVLREAA